jgi:hypothetical protein
MPTYHNLPSHNGYYIKIRPKSRIRRLFDLGYFSGDKIDLEITFDVIDPKTAKKNPIQKLKIQERHPEMINGSPFIYYWNIPRGKGGGGVLNLNGHAVNGSGEFSVFIVEADSSIYNGGCLMTTDIIHKDNLRFQAILLISGAVFGFIANVVALIIFGVIKIDPTWFVKATP